MVTRACSVLNFMTGFDLSSNRFSGEIQSEMGELMNNEEGNFLELEKIDGTSWCELVMAPASLRKKT
uniref:Uncharacterized protein n=1 Tax=Salix viminalis TaxID=40686 RepID=A0A6N2LJB1_SALVM